jgi:hypothetical protein
MTTSDYKAWKQQEEWFDRRIEERRKKQLANVLKIAKKVCPIPYEKLVHLVFLEYGLGYNQNQKRGVYSKELDSLIAVGKLVLGKKRNGLLVVYYEKEGLQRALEISQ